MIVDLCFLPRSFWTTTDLSLLLPKGTFCQFRCPACCAADQRQFVLIEVTNLPFRFAASMVSLLRRFSFFTNLVSFALSKIYNDVLLWTSK
jgi:hypothetical protein